MCLKIAYASKHFPNARNLHVGNWQISINTLIAMPKVEIWRHHSFLYRAKNIYTYVIGVINAINGINTVTFYFRVLCIIGGKPYVMHKLHHKCTLPKLYIRGTMLIYSLEGN